MSPEKERNRRLKGSSNAAVSPSPLAFVGASKRIVWTSLDFVSLHPPTPAEPPFVRGDSVGVKRKLNNLTRATCVKILYGWGRGEGQMIGIAKIEHNIHMYQ